MKKFMIMIVIGMLFVSFLSECAEIDFDVTFPCGYGYHFKSKGVTTDVSIPLECPMHGKDCKAPEKISEELYEKVDLN